MRYMRACLKGVHSEKKVTCEIAKMFVLRKHSNIFHFNNVQAMKKKKKKINMRPAIQSNHRCNMYKTATLP